MVAPNHKTVSWGAPPQTRRPPASLDVAASEALEFAVRALLTEPPPGDSVLFLISKLCTYANVHPPEHLIRQIGILKSENEVLREYVRQVDSSLLHEIDSNAQMDHSEDESSPDNSPIQPLSARERRPSVSAEVYGCHNQPPRFLPPVYPHSENEKQRLQSLFSRVFLFATLEIDCLSSAVDAAERVLVEKGTEIISQGDDGDAFFVVDTGAFVVTKTSQGETKEVLRCGEGDFFGELELLYNNPREATVIAVADSCVWRLDRSTFNNIVRGSAVRKKSMYDHFLKEVPLLNSTDEHTRCRIADCLKTLSFEEGDVIIRENDPGDRFFLLESGDAVATKCVDGHLKTVMEYEHGDYFGELALLRQAPRAATITATTPVKVAYLDRTSFSRLLGSLSDVLKARNYD